MMVPRFNRLIRSVRRKHLLGVEERIVNVI